MMRLRMRAGLGCLATLVAMAACSGEDQPPIVPGTGGGGEGGATVQLVPADLPEIEGSSYCIPLEENEVLAGVSPEGHAWLMRSSEGAQTLRVADPFDVSVGEETQLEIGPIRKVQPWSATDAVVLADDGLWVLNGLSRVSVDLPAAPAEVDSLCGDFSQTGLILGKGTMYELRDQAWWSFAGLSQSSYAPTKLADVDGNCVANDNYTSVLGKDGSLMLFGPSTYVPTAEFSAAAQVVATNGMVAVLDEDQLHVGPNTWQQWAFEGDAPTQIAASGGFVWLRSADRLVRFDGSDFVSVTKLPETAGQDLKVHAGGVWLSSTKDVCHVATGPMLRLSGIRPHQQSLEETLSFTVSSSDPELEIKASVDGETVALSSVDGAWTANLELTSVGWHELVVEGVDVRRRVALKRIPKVTRSWEADIKPIYEETCAGGPCHAPTSTAAPSLETFEDWVGLAATINNRVVLAGTMPPASAQPPDWDEKKTIIAEWLEGGMLP